MLTLLGSWNEVFGGAGERYPQHYMAYEDLRPGYGMPSRSSTRLDEVMTADQSMRFGLEQYTCQQKCIPYLNTYDGRTIHYLEPLIKANETMKLELERNKIVDFIKFDVGNVLMVTGGRNRGCPLHQQHGY
ncbi:40S ribosomal protein S4 [Striga asiatica]|uniref:40S ribosomal protein S4 n=1 Tax=Striga asiatica TaxID=4170 RepID=A0A5A7PN50_STRAF|nr:40S ribosomal protein S4 [Striga asiatica]